MPEPVDTAARSAAAAALAAASAAAAATYAQYRQHLEHRDQMIVDLYRDHHMTPAAIGRSCQPPLRRQSVWAVLRARGVTAHNTPTGPPT